MLETANSKAYESDPCDVIALFSTFQLLHFHEHARKTPLLPPSPRAAGQGAGDTRAARWLSLNCRQRLEAQRDQAPVAGSCWEAAQMGTHSAGTP